MEPIFDTELAIARRLRALRRSTHGADFLLARACDDLDERLATVQRTFPLAASLFACGPHVAAALRATGKVGEVLRVEAHPGFGGDMVVPAETLPIAAAGLDLAVSLLALHEVNDVPGLLVQVRRALKPDGLFLAAIPGAGTLDELRQSLLAAETEIAGGAGPRVAPFLDVRDAGALLQRAGFALPVADVEPLTVRYADMFALMRDLRAMGATNTLLARSRRPMRRDVLMRAAEFYAARFADPDGRIRASFPMVWISGWAPDAAQQKPARRGSGTVSLADYLAGPPSRR